LNGSSRNLDILRALAVFSVLFDHTLLALGYNHFGSVNFIWIGRAGVMFFFVHTSLVLMYSLERSPDARSFYLRRAFRIYPLCMVAVTFAYFVFSPSAPLSRRDFLLNLALFQNVFGGKNAFGELWSLPLEIQMYLVLPLLFWIARNHAKALVAVWVVAMAVMFWWSMFIFVPCFLAGIISYALSRRVPRILPHWAWPFTVIAVMLIFASFPGWKRCWWPCLLLGVLIPLFAEAKKSLFSAAATQTAKYSYGIYLSHPFVISFAIVHLESRPVWLRIAEFVVLNFALPVVAFHLIENPGIAAGKRLAAQLFACRPEPLLRTRTAEVLVDSNL